MVSSYDFQQENVCKRFRCSFASDAMQAMAKISKRVPVGMSMFARNFKAALHHESRYTTRRRDRVKIRALDCP